MSEKWKPKIKIWDGTNVHASMDTIIAGQVANDLNLLGFNAEHKGQWSFEDLHNGKVAFVTHPRRLASINPYTVSQRDAEKFMIQMCKGALPNNISMSVAAHGHTSRGSIDDDPFRILNLPCWTTFIEYQKALQNFAHFQPDIGAYFIIITKDGRTHTQKWLYKPFVYNHFEGKIYEAGDPTERYAEDKKVAIETYFLKMVKDARFVVACIADTHVGEVASIAPSKYSYAGRTYEVAQTEANKRLYAYWKNFVDVCKLLKPTEIWVVGDMVAGTQVFEKNRRTLTLNLEEQKSMFVELMKELL